MLLTAEAGDTALGQSAFTNQRSAQPDYGSAMPSAPHGMHAKVCTVQKICLRSTSAKRRREGGKRTRGCSNLLFPLRISMEVEDTE